MFALVLTFGLRIPVPTPHFEHFGVVTFIAFEGVSIKVIALHPTHWKYSAIAVGIVSA